MERRDTELTIQEPKHKWRVLALLALAELLAVSIWFSASAVVPALTEIWHLDDAGRAWMTMSVQAGFVVGALGSALLGLPDRLPAHRLLFVSALLAAGANACIPLLARGIGLALLLRFLSGMLVAGIYPVGMKIMATWTRRDRGFAIGLLVGALTIGLAAPHLLYAMSSRSDWRSVLYLASGLTVAGAFIILLLVKEGPYRGASPQFDWRHIGRILKDRPVLLANFGYLGHMWELFAMLAWAPLFILASFEGAGVSSAWAGIAAFAVIASGALGSVVSGLLADKFGRTRVTVMLLSVSGACCLIAGHTFGAHPVLVLAVMFPWGLTVNADSAQYSACVSELCDPRYTGTALTLQTCLGFLLTMATIRIVPTMADALGWDWAFSILAIGPLVGIAAMIVLRRSPAASRLAGGRG